MADNIRIYIHGRPQGQDVWSARPNQSDMSYIKSFLDSRIGNDVDGALVVDTWNDRTYYTYVLRKNVYEKSLRPEAYFAITLCIADGVWCNVSWLYELLESVYRSKCQNMILKHENGSKQFLIGQFTEIELKLGDIDALIRVNLAKYRETYLKPIGGYVSTLNSQPQTYSLKEVDSPAFYEDCRQSTIVVSREYPTKVAQLEAKLKEGDTANVKLKKQLQSASETVSASCAKELDDKEREIALLKRQLKQLMEQHGTAGTRPKGIETGESDINRYKDILNSFLIVKVPLIQFARLLASRFPEGSQDNLSGYSQTSQITGEIDSIVPAPHPVHDKKNICEVWIRWINSAILCIILALVVDLSVRQVRVNQSNTNTCDLFPDREIISYDYSCSGDTTYYAKMENDTFVLYYRYMKQESSSAKTTLTPDSAKYQGHVKWQWISYSTSNDSQKELGDDLDCVKIIAKFKNDSVHLMTILPKPKNDNSQAKK
ncbi:MAG: hypothetical protein NC080_05710 [Paraprevotella sp.]|nr:hypothetical protein [Paraprevotella sp.]